MYRVFYYIIIALLLTGCSSEKQAEIQTPEHPESEKQVISRSAESRRSSGITDPASYSLWINPQTAFRNTVFYSVPKKFNLADAKIEWLINGRPDAEAHGSQFKAHNVRKGDTVQARAIMNNREILSNSVTIRNSPPEVSMARFIPEIFKPDETLGVEVKGSDSDGDAVTIFYEWTKNEEPVGTSEKIEVPFKRGDKLSVKITPFDGEEHGPSVILRRAVLNLPPMIIDNKNLSFDGKIYSYKITAEDPDDDPLTYSLKTAPAGMRIDAKTGMITWNVPPDFIGKAPLTVSVTDGNGGESTQQLTLTIGLPE